MRNVLHFARTGQGKGICAGARLYELGERSKWIEKKLNKIRYIYVNYKLNPQSDWFKKYGKYYKYWTEPIELLEVRDADVIIDEIGSIFPADGWKDTPKSIRKFFTHFRKRGIEIFGFTQDYGMVDINYRRIVNVVYQSFKAFGSSDISATLPEVKHPWGLIVLYELDIESLHRDGDLERVGGLPSWELIRKKYVEMYDTREEIVVSLDVDLPHVVKVCRTCGYREEAHRGRFKVAHSH